jgi:site-specific recombinase XerD
VERIPNIGTLDAEISSGSATWAPGTCPTRRSPAYTYGVRQFERFLEAHGLPTQIRDIERAHVEESISDVLQRSKPGTAQTRYRDLQQFLRYLVDTGEIDVSPMVQMRSPSSPRSRCP